MPQPTSMSLAGRCALITGGSRGIGRAIALALAQCGADVVVTCESNIDAAEQVAQQARSLGARAAAVQASLAADDGPAVTYQKSLAALGRIDILVLNASLQLPTPWLQVSREQFEQQVAINLRASLQLMQLAAPAMIERQWGRIVTLGSVQEARPHPDMIVYAATKSAQENMVRNLARQLAPHGVTVNNLAPGVIDTDRNKERLTDPAYRTQVLAKIPAGFLGESEDCAGAALLLCSDAGRYITGQTLFVDGGLSLP